MCAEPPDTGATSLAHALREAGVQCVYGIPGQRILPLFHALDQVGITIILTRHEQAAAFMADTHARISGFGVCLATSGPGAINLLGGLAAAWMDSVPILAITAQTATDEVGHYGIQEGSGLGRTPNIPAMFQATVKDTWQPTHPDQITPMLCEALATARNSRPGPVHLDLPSNLLTAPVTTRRTSPPPQPQPTIGGTVDPVLVGSATAALRQARRPVILAGGGLADPDTARLLNEFAETADLPITGTLAAKRFLDEHHPLVLGPVGVYGRFAANHALHHEADLVLALGVAFSYLTTAGWTAPLPPERLIRVDLDPRELHNTHHAGIAVPAATRTFLTALSPYAHQIRGDGTRRTTRLRAEHPDPAAPAPASARPHPIAVCQEINRHLDERTTLLADVGQNAYWVERHLRTRGDNRFLINAGLGSMSHAVAGALGAWRARQHTGSGERIIVTTGDGGFLMAASEISTAVADGAAITWIVFDNGTLGTQRAWFDQNGHSPVACFLPPTDLVALARSLGADGRRIHNISELDVALTWATERAAPTVLDVIIDPVPAPTPYRP